MNNVDPKVMGKIKKCLALSASTNPDEAATALRQANALMEKHGVTDYDVTISDIGESETDSKTMARDKPARWEARLAVLVARAFGCQMMVSRAVWSSKLMGHANKGSYKFVGLKAQAEVAAYTATVLIRRCKKARQEWLSENFGGIGVGLAGMKAKKTRMGDAFAEGWVISIGKLVHEFANPPQIEKAIARYVDERTATGQEAPTRGLDVGKIGVHEQLAAAHGMRAAAAESLHRPMKTEDAPIALACG